MGAFGGAPKPAAGGGAWTDAEISFTTGLIAEFSSAKQDLSLLNAALTDATAIVVYEMQISQNGGNPAGAGTGGPPNPNVGLYIGDPDAGGDLANWSPFVTALPQTVTTRGLAFPIGTAPWISVQENGWLDGGDIDYAITLKIKYQ